MNKIETQLWKAEKYGYSRAFSAIKGDSIRVSDIEPAHAGQIGYTSSSNTIHLAYDHECMKGLNAQGKRAFRCGVATHELMHQLLTDFVLNNRSLISLPPVEKEILGTINNYVEDARIEHFAYQFVGGTYLKCLEFAIAWTYNSSPKLSEMKTPFEQFMMAIQQFGDQGLPKGRFTFPEAKEVFDQVAPIFYKATIETNPRRVMKYSKDIFELSRPLWKDQKDLAELMQKLQEMAQKNGKSLHKNSTGGKASTSAEEEEDGEGSSSGSSARRKMTAKEISRREYEQASGSGSGGSGSGERVTVKDAKTAEEAAEAAQEAAEDAADAQDAANDAKQAAEEAKGTPNESSAQKAAERAQRAADRAKEAAESAKRNADEAQKAKDSGDTEGEERSAKQAGRDALKANAAMKSAQNADDAANGKDTSSSSASSSKTAQDASEKAGEANESANEAQEAADEAEARAQDAEAKAEEAKNSGSSDASKLEKEANEARKSAERAKKSAEKAKEAADRAKESAEKAQKAQDAEDEYGESANAHNAGKAARDAAREAAKAKREASGKANSQPGAKANDAEEYYDASQSNDEGDNLDREVTDRCLDGCNPDYSNCDEDFEEHWDPTPTEFDVEDYTLTDDDFASIDTEVKSCLEDVEKEEAAAARENEVPLPDFKIESARISKAATCLNRKIKVGDTEHAMELYGELMTKLRPGVNSLYGRLHNIFMNDVENTDYRSSGKLNYKRLNSGRMTARVFDKHRLPSEKAKTAVMILIDESGSMSGRKSQTAKQTAIALAETFYKLNIPTYVMGFTADCSGYDAVHNHYVTWKNSMNERLRLLDITARSDNFDGYSIRYGGEILKRVNAEHKLMIVVSDGSPACFSYNSGADGIADTKDAIRTVRRDADVLGVLIGGYDVEELQSMYGNDFISVTCIEELFASLAKRIVHIVNKWE